MVSPVMHQASNTATKYLQVLLTSKRTSAPVRISDNMRSDRHCRITSFGVPPSNQRPVTESATRLISEMARQNLSTLVDDPDEDELWDRFYEAM
jgi:hypothetical protein